jgi:hypothetical protein
MTVVDDQGHVLIVAHHDADTFYVDIDTHEHYDHLEPLEPPMP